MRQTTMRTRTTRTTRTKDDEVSPCGCTNCTHPPEYEDDAEDDDAEPETDLKPQDLSKRLSEPPRDWDMDESDDDDDDEDESEDDEFNDPTYVPGDDSDGFGPRSYRAARAARRNGKACDADKTASDPKASDPERYILNPVTNKYVLKSGAVGKRILRDSGADSDGAKTKAKAKPTRDPKIPKMPLSAYMHFTRDARPRIIKRNPELRFGEIGKMLGQEWRELSETAKQVYCKMAADDKIRFERERGELRI